MTKDEQYMTRCFELALKGAGNVSPNPMVGCVIVKNGKIVAEGYHKKYGTNHGERAAIVSALKKGINLKGAELYVNLEPCAHFGKTPPCSDLIIEHNFSKVVIGVKDPYHEVAGKGIARMKKAGIKVITGVLEEEAKELNKFFFKFVATGLPYITIKAAQTIDGKIADDKYRSKWISSTESRRTVHKLRSVYDAVLVGANTVKYDNPKLNVRDVRGRDPYRIIIDKDLALKHGYDVYKYADGKTIVITSLNAEISKIKLLQKKNIIVLPCKIKNGKIDLADALKKLASHNIASIMVEGGAFVYNEFLKAGLVDEMLIFIAPDVMGSDITAFSDKKSFKDFSSVNYYTSSRDILVNLR
ncbi:MAG: bifunctional diaminohydroxyphosphoribosylaminopyrimidine deaminase/5-amino-6-(5-phosphoribosylamino)uracil reductase RibD, partial [Ignavibacteria bacterium]|nr:bifunctional diaminohydroxyphosphoribosylaminopyrimidine deaminase/5-amino-6-(5-phosphoribosylamino)uracil reductase RibD [Ignavibacteria bacterium]